MKAKIKFEKMFFKLPEKARREWHLYYECKPISISVCWLEIKLDTYMGKKILKQLGYE